MYDARRSPRNHAALQGAETLVIRENGLAVLFAKHRDLARRVVVVEAGTPHVIDALDPVEF